MTGLGVSKSGFVIMAALLAFSAPWAPEGAAAAPDEPPSGCCGLAYAHEDEPPWLRRVLRKLKSKRLPHILLDDYRLFKHAGRPSYLVLIWNDRARHDTEEFQVYRVRVRSPGNVRLSGLFEFTSPILDLERPTGIWADHDGAPLVVLSYGSGGTWYGGYGIRIFRLHKGITEVTPVDLGRPVAVEDVDGDGEFDAITSDDRWGNFYQGCGGCGPLVPVVLQRTSSGYRLKCREAKSFYDEGNRRTADWLKENKPDLLSGDSFSARIDIILNRIQSGDTEGGAKELRNFLNDARTEIDKRTAAGEDVAVYQAYYDRTDLEFTRAATEARRNVAAQCPLSETSAPGAHHGAVERVESFRVGPTGR